MVCCEGFDLGVRCKAVDWAVKHSQYLPNKVLESTILISVFAV
jgi:hypothetical protein